ATDASRSAALLRYFNPVGAHESGDIGEDPRGIPNNLVPYIADVATGKRPELSVFGDDYDTFDGTGVRDYIHITDLADGHIAAMTYLANHQGVEVFNLGTGEDVTIIELAETIKKVVGFDGHLKFDASKPDGTPRKLLDVSKIHKLGWKHNYDLETGLTNAYEWYMENSNGTE
ncbi:MAG: NAD-dependent epimerase/dehydratase family protein, partial [Alphaproteobacteria bacterium]|nr:NAD-dependent epimerase/dehydratase family protein [Alphaproteobacteria bacterium]